MAAAAAGNHILLLYKHSILVSGVTGKLPGLCFVALFSMAQSCRSASISTSLRYNVGSMTDAVMYLYTLIARFSYPARDPETEL